MAGRITVPGHGNEAGGRRSLMCKQSQRETKNEPPKHEDTKKNGTLMSSCLADLGVCSRPMRFARLTASRIRRGTYASYN
jgi:hypothetical protein